jgi:hypothetical protein
MSPIVQQLVSSISISHVCLTETLTRCCFDALLPAGRRGEAGACGSEAECGVQYDILGVCHTLAFFTVLVTKPRSA